MIPKGPGLCRNDRAEGKADQASPYREGGVEGRPNRRYCRSDRPASERLESQSARTTPGGRTPRHSWRVAREKKGGGTAGWSVHHAKAAPGRAPTHDPNMI